MQMSGVISTETVWIQYHSMLYNFILSRVSDKATTEDILQDVFQKIHSRMHTLRENNKIQSWLYQITRNTIVDYYRTRKKLDELPEAFPVSEPRPNKAVRDEIASWTLPFINQLPEKYRDVLILSEIEGIKYSTIADQTGLSLSGVKTRVQRGRALLREEFLNCCKFAFDSSGNIIDYTLASNCSNKC
jgi:RNA polymerase sigma-70 factor (ECF subfamily)